MIFPCLKTFQLLSLPLKSNPNLCSSLQNPPRQPLWLHLLMFLLPYYTPATQVSFLVYLTNTKCFSASGPLYLLTHCLFYPPVSFQVAGFCVFFSPRPSLLKDIALPLAKVYLTQSVIPSPFFTLFTSFIAFTTIILTS